MLKYYNILLLTSITDYNETIELAKNLKGIYDKSVIFHCYWNGNLNEKHLYSIISCYYWHNKWNMDIEDNSIILQLVEIIKKNLY